MLVSGGVLIWATGDGAAKGAAEGAAVLELAISAIWAPPWPSFLLYIKQWSV